MPCAAPSRNNLGVQGPCGFETYTDALCFPHWQMKNGLLPTRPANLFPNPSAETDLSYWWSSGTPTNGRSNVQAKFGSWSYRATDPPNGQGLRCGGTANDGSIASYLPVQPNTLYTWSVWARFDNGATAQVYFRQFDATGAFLGQPSIAPSFLAATWTQCSLSAVTPPTCTLCDLLVINASGSVNPFYLDGAGLALGSVPAT